MDGWWVIISVCLNTWPIKKESPKRAIIKFIALWKVLNNMQSCRGYGLRLGDGTTKYDLLMSELSCMGQGGNSDAFGQVCFRPFPLFLGSILESVTLISLSTKTTDFFTMNGHVLISSLFMFTFWVCLPMFWVTSIVFSFCARQSTSLITSQKEQHLKQTLLIQDQHLGSGPAEWRDSGTQTPRGRAGRHVISSFFRRGFDFPRVHAIESSIGVTWKMKFLSLTDRCHTRSF